MMSPEQFTQGVVAFDGLKESVGLALAVSFVFNMVVLFLYFGERRDRRMSWKAHNAMLKENIEVMSKLEASVSLLIAIQKPAARRRPNLPEKVVEPPIKLEGHPDV
jgi:hypothetical protein